MKNKLISILLIFIMSLTFSMPLASISSFAEDDALESSDSLEPEETLTEQEKPLDTEDSQAGVDEIENEAIVDEINQQQSDQSQTDISSDEIDSESDKEADEELTEEPASIEPIESGTCGDDLVWTLDTEGTLNIKGTGPMYNYNSTSTSPFENRTDIKSLIIGDGVTKIGDRAFYNCTGLQTVTNQSNTLGIFNQYAFYRCSNLTEVHDSSNNASYGVGPRAFFLCSNLTVFPFEKVAYLYSFSFYACGFKEITLPGNIAGIEECAFLDCSSLENVYIRKGISHIDGGETYQYTDQGTLVHGVRTSPFKDCSSLKVIYCEENEKPSSWGYRWNERSQGGITIPVHFGVIEADYQYVVKDIDGEKNVVVPEGVTKLYGKFKNNTSVESITLPETYTTVESYAFQGCSGLKEVVLPYNLLKIENGTFNNCVSLESINIPTGLKTIGSGAFSKCEQLQEIYIPESVESLSDSAFQGYPNAVICEGNPNINPTDPKVFLKQVSRELFEYLKGLDSDTSMVIIPENISIIPDKVFQNYIDISRVFIPYDVKAFSGNAILPDNIQRIWYEGSQEDFEKLELSSCLSNKCIVSYNVKKDDILSIKSISTASISGVENRSYTGKEITLDITVRMEGETLKEGVDYLLKYSNNLECGDAELQIIGTGQYYDFINCIFTIEKPKTEDINVEDIPDQSYCGRKIEPSVKVWLRDNELVEGKDYTLSYRNNTNIGTAFVDIQLSELFIGEKQLTKSFIIIEDPSISQDDLGYQLTVSAGKEVVERHKEGEIIVIYDMNDIAYKTFKNWTVLSGDLSIPSSQANKSNISITMPSSDVSIKAIYSGQSLDEELASENTRHNAVIMRASTLKANIKTYTDTANKIKNKYGVSYLQSSTYYNNQANSTQTELTKKQQRLAILRADTSGGHQVEIRQLEAEIAELQSDYQMYLELKSAAQFQEKANAAQSELDNIDLDEEERIHENNIANICQKHGVKNASVAEIEYIQLDKDEYEFTGNQIYPLLTVIDANGQKLGNESYEIVYPDDCTTEGNHVITIRLKGDYTGTKEKSFTIVKHKYGEWIITKEASCTENGSKEKICSDCGKKIVEVIPAAHSYSDWTTVKEPTCTEEGKKERVCSVCGNKEEAVISASGHQWNTGYTIDVPATGSFSGSQSIHCSVCGTVKEGSVVVIPQLAPAAPAEIVDLPAVKISKPTAGKKKITVKWKKVSKANLKKISGIQIQVATDPGFSNIVKTATAGKKKTSKAIKGLQSKTKYYVRIRAYAAGNHVSAWKSKSVKVK